MADSDSPSPPPSARDRTVTKSMGLHPAATMSEAAALHPAPLGATLSSECRVFFLYEEGAMAFLLACGRQHAGDVDTGHGWHRQGLGRCG